MPRCCFKYHVIEMTLIFLALIWMSVTYFMVLHTSSSSSREATNVKGAEKELLRHSSIKLEPKLLSRSQDVKVTADVRGNLGPIEVIKQANPGTNWIKDRWQAASDMHLILLAQLLLLPTCTSRSYFSFSTRPHRHQTLPKTITPNTKKHNSKSW